MPGERARGDGLTQVFRIPEFRALWAAELISAAGDQLARIALAVLVYGRTGSAGWAATVYALTFLPAMLGGVLLGGLADRHRRREVMVVADVARAGLVAVMAIPGLSLWALCALLVVVVLISAVHSAAQAALLPAVLPGEHYERGLAVRQITSQAVQLAAFAGGGLLLLVVSPVVALAINAMSFIVSAAVLRFAVAERPVPDRDPEESDPDEGTDPAPPGRPRRSMLRDGIDAFGRIMADPSRRALLCLVWLVSCYVVPEALAAPYAASFGGGPLAVGLLMAADPMGSVVGAFLFSRFVPAHRRSRLVGVIAVLAGVPLALCILAPGLPVSILLWAVSGALATAYLVQAQALFVRATPDAQRGRVVGVAASGLVATQGIGVFAGGLLADVWNPTVAVAVAGVTGSVLAVGAALAWRSADRSGRDAPVAAGVPGGH
ncbi:MFS transporter [Pseudonocardia bannensis]|uniref:MFS transporter n=1 Tax=Pseudonocardia bannensis TaxID=630973 RepID=A0A848DLP6_9PSEU|nr:MFS transporter [Pseudonocardia bannensis]NMH93638.1 MFS transporter [Pseudonocardia bannensis]